MSGARAARSAATSLAAAPGQDFAGAMLASMHGAQLRGLRFADAGDLTVLHHEPVLRRLMLDPVPTAFLGIASLIIRANRMHIDQPGFGIWHASDRDGHFVGLLSLLPVAAGEIELGLRLLPSMAMSEAVGTSVDAVCRHAFETLDLLRLAAQVHVDDQAAVHWLVANGFAPGDAPSRHGAQARAYLLDQRTWKEREAGRTGVRVRAPGACGS